MASGGDTVLDVYEWEKLPNMPTKRCYTVGAHHQDKLYVLGKVGWGSNTGGKDHAGTL